MQAYIDAVTGQYWSMDDDVIATPVAEGLVFHTALGAPLVAIPKTLQRVEKSPEPVSEQEITPAPVSRWQGREAMRLTPYGDPRNGLSLFDATVALLSKPDTPLYYQTAWDELQVFEPDSPMLAAIADELGLTNDDRRILFLFAATLKA